MTQVEKNKLVLQISSCIRDVLDDHGVELTWYETDAAAAAVVNTFWCKDE